MTFQFLENTLWILQCEIALGEAEALAFVSPALHRVLACVLIPAREIAVSVVFRVAVIVTQNAGRIRVVHDIIAEEQFVLDNVSYESAQKRDVAPGADRDPDISQRA
jgi:hypothetical protein